jgi:hypothetical protein
MSINVGQQYIRQWVENDLMFEAMPLLGLLFWNMDQQVINKQSQ